MKAEDFDIRFEAEQDISGILDADAAQRPGRTQRRVNVDLPAWTVDALDREATRLGVTRQSVIKILLAERLDRMDPTAA